MFPSIVATCCLVSYSFVAQFVESSSVLVLGEEYSNEIANSIIEIMPELPIDSFSINSSTAEYWIKNQNVLLKALEANEDAELIVLSVGLFDLLEACKKGQSLNSFATEFQRNLLMLVKFITARMPRARILSSTYFFPNLLSNQKCTQIASTLFDQPATCQNSLSNECINSVIGTLSSGLLDVANSIPGERFIVVDTLCDLLNADSQPCDHLNPSPQHFFSDCFYPTHEAFKILANSIVTKGAPEAFTFLQQQNRERLAFAEDEKFLDYNYA